MIRDNTQLQADLHAALERARAAEAKSQHLSTALVRINNAAADVNAYSHLASKREATLRYIQLCAHKALLGTELPNFAE